MAMHTIGIHLQASDRPQVGAALDLPDEKVNIRVHYAGLFNDLDFYATRDQMEAIGRGILDAISRQQLDRSDVIEQAEQTATVDQAMAILRAAMLREHLQQWVPVSEVTVEDLSEVSVEEDLERG